MMVVFFLYFYSPTSNRLEVYLTEQYNFQQLKILPTSLHVHVDNAEINIIVDH